jgi:hypothetical protein
LGLLVSEDKEGDEEEERLNLPGPFLYHFPDSCGGMVPYDTERGTGSGYSGVSMNPLSQSSRKGLYIWSTESLALEVVVVVVTGGDDVEDERHSGSLVCVCGLRLLEDGVNGAVWWSWYVSLANI